MNNHGIIGGGIKCDNPECDFVDMSVEISEYDSWLNRPCPECGSNLLTKEDLEGVKLMIVLAKMAQAVQSDGDDGEVAIARFNGTGSIEIEIANDSDKERIINKLFNK